MQTETIFFSIFDDVVLTPLPGLVPTLLSVPLEPDFISVHRHTLEPGRFLVFEWFAGRQLGEPINVATLENARCYVPETFTLEADAPASFGAIGCWKAGA